MTSIDYKHPRPREWHDGPLFLLALFGASICGWLIVVLLLSIA